MLVPQRSGLYAIGGKHPAQPDTGAMRRDAGRHQKGMEVYPSRKLVAGTLRYIRRNALSSPVIRMLMMSSIISISVSLSL